MSFTKIEHYEKEYLDTHHDSALNVAQGVEDQPVVNPYFVRRKRRVMTTDEYVAGTRLYRHIGLYGYRCSVLERICAMEQGFLEQTEKLEQLRWLENGLRIKVAETALETYAVDTPEDLESINKMFID